MYDKYKRALEHLQETLGEDDVNIKTLWELIRYCEDSSSDLCIGCPYNK